MFITCGFFAYIFKTIIMSISQTTDALFLLAAAPVDRKMQVDTIQEFDDWPKAAKWPGMLVFVTTINKWHIYNEQTDKLELFVADDMNSKHVFVNSGRLIVFKHPANSQDNVIEVNDMCMGYVQNEFVFAKYIGGDIATTAAFDIRESYTE